MTLPAHPKSFALAAALLAASIGSAQVLDPAAYLEASENAVSLPRVLAAYNSWIDEADPVLLGILDILSTTRRIDLPSVDGEVGGVLAGIDGFFYFRFLTVDDISFRALFLPSMFALVLDARTKEDYGSEYGDASLGWFSGWALCGVQARRGEDRLTLGAVLRVQPMVDPGPPALLDHGTVSADSGAITEDTSFDRFYADVSWNGWRADAMLSAEFIERLAAEKLFELAGREMKLGPAAQFLGRDATFKPGIAATWNPRPWISTAASAKAAIGESGVGFGEAELGFGLVLPLIHDIRGSGKDMALRFDARASLLEFENGLLPGASAEIRLENYPFISWFDLVGLKYLGTMSGGISWNYAASVDRMGYADQFLIYLRMGGGYYSKLDW